MLMPFATIDDMEVLIKKKVGIALNHTPIAVNLLLVSSVEMPGYI